MILNLDRCKTPKYEAGGLSIEFAEFDTVKITIGKDCYTIVDKELFCSGENYDIFYQKEEYLLIVGEESNYISSVSFHNGSIGKILLVRSETDDTGFYRQVFEELSDGVLFIYEGGMIRISKKGAVLWKFDIPYLDIYYDYLDVELGIVVFKHEDNEVVFDLDNGELIRPKGFV